MGLEEEERGRKGNDTDGVRVSACWPTFYRTPTFKYEQERKVGRQKPPNLESRLRLRFSLPRKTSYFDLKKKKNTETQLRNLSQCQIIKSAANKPSTVFSDSVNFFGSKLTQTHSSGIHPSVTSQWGGGATLSKGVVTRGLSLRSCSDGAAEHKQGNLRMCPTWNL